MRTATLIAFCAGLWTTTPACVFGQIPDSSGRDSSIYAPGSVRERYWSYNPDAAKRAATPRTRPDHLAAASVSAKTYDCSAQSDIPTADCEGLVAMYHSMNGDFWQYNDGWLVSSPCSWFGIECIIAGYYKVSLYWNWMSGPIPPEIGQLTHALKFDISDNDITGSIPPQLGNLSELRELYLIDTPLAGPIPTELTNLTKLEIIYLASWQLTGSIPPDFGDLTKLRDFTVRDTQVSGPIPSSLGNLSELKWLVLHSNDLTGPVPPSLGGLSKLWVLDLGNNGLTGPVPAALGSLTSLKSLTLSFNNLTGRIPESLGNLHDLEGIGLRNNDLDGTVPLPVARISSYAMCDLVGNAPGLCMPDIAPYQVLSTNGAVCGLPLKSSCEPVVHVDAKILLQGPVQGSGMAGDSAFTHHVPNDQPYADPRFDGTPLDHDSPDTVTSPPDSALDWVLVSLRSEASPAGEIAASRRAAFVLQNGSIVDTTGGTLAFAGVAPGPYYLVVRHRNHTSVMSADTLDLSDGIATWNFTSAMVNGYSEGGDPMKSLPGGKFGLHACDVNADGVITVADFNLWSVSNSTGSRGYEQADCNLDGFVTAEDFMLWNANTTVGAAGQVP